MKINRRQFGIMSCLGLMTSSFLIKKYESNEAKLIKNLIENVERAYVPKEINNFYTDPCLYRYGKIGIYGYGPRYDNIIYTMPVPTLCIAFETSLSLKCDIKKMDKLFGTLKHCESKQQPIKYTGIFARSKGEILYKLREMLRKA